METALLRAVLFYGKKGASYGVSRISIAKSLVIFRKKTTIINAAG